MSLCVCIGGERGAQLYRRQPDFCKALKYNFSQMGMYVIKVFSCCHMCQNIDIFISLNQRHRINSCPQFDLGKRGLEISFGPKRKPKGERGKLFHQMVSGNHYCSWTPSNHSHTHHPKPVRNSNLVVSFARIQHWKF